jgi:peptide/nickel transport system substrate-binding protein
MLKFRTLSVVAILIAVLSIGGAISWTQEGEETVKTLAYGTIEPIESLNPLLAATAVYWGAWFMVYDGLYTIGPGGKPVPDLAVDVDVSDDGKTYTFKIMEGVKFHDGTPLTAYDGVFTYNYVIEQELSFMYDYARPIEKVNALDEYTLQFKLKERYARSWLEATTFMQIPFWPKHIWEAITKEEALEELPLEKLIGSGPFQFVEFEPEVMVMLRAHDHPLRGRPKIDELLIRVFATTASAIEALKAGEISMLDTVPPAVASTLSRDPRISIEAVVSTMFDMVAYNSYQSAYAEGRKKHPHPALQDPKLRRAMSWALDKVRLANLAYVGYALPGTQLLSPGFGEFSNTSLEPRGFDLAKARELLDEAGYKDTDGDGIRETGDGLPLEFDIWVTPEYGPDIAIFDLWSAWLKKVGIKLNPAMMDYGTLWERELTGFFDMLSEPWQCSTADFQLYILTCAAIEAEWNPYGYCNERYDALYEEQRKTTSFEERKEIIWKMQEVVYRDLPLDILDYPQIIVGWRNDKIRGDLNLIDPLHQLLNRFFMSSVEKVG